MATVVFEQPEPVEPQVILTLSFSEASALFWNLFPQKADGTPDYDLLCGIEDSLGQVGGISADPPAWFIA